MTRHVLFARRPMLLGLGAAALPGQLLRQALVGVAFDQQRGDLALARGEDDVAMARRCVAARQGRQRLQRERRQRLLASG